MALYESHETSKGKLYPLLVALLVFLLDVPIGSAYISDAQDAPLEEVIGKIPHLSAIGLR